MRKIFIHIRWRLFVAPFLGRIRLAQVTHIVVKLKEKEHDAFGKESAGNGLWFDAA